MSIKEFKKLKTLTFRIGKETEILINKTQGKIGGIFYCRTSGGFSVSSSNELSCNLTGRRFESQNDTIHVTANQSPIRPNLQPQPVYFSLPTSPFLPFAKQ